MTDPKEPHYLAMRGSHQPAFCGPGDKATINREAVIDRASYLDLFRRADHAAARGEASVSTLYYHARSIPAIREVAAGAKIIILLREPVSRAFSSHQYMAARGFEMLNFEDALRAEPSRKRQNWHHQWHCTGLSEYAAAVGAFLTAFGAQNVGIWSTDDLQTDYAGTVAAVRSFIGAPPMVSAIKSPPPVNISGTPRSAFARLVVGRLTASPHARSTIKHIVPFRTREAFRRRLLQPSQARADTRARLEVEFNPDLSRLSSLLRGAYDRADLPVWVR